MSLSPFLRSPFTDLTGGMISHQMLGRCQKHEARYMDCLEAYGLERGDMKCKALLDDFMECQSMNKQFLRFRAYNLYTDGLKSAQGVGSALFDPQCNRSYKWKLHKDMCVMSGHRIGFEAMRIERERQIAAGTLKYDRYVNPRIDSF